MIFHGSLFTVALVGNHFFILFRNYPRSNQDDVFVFSYRHKFEQIKKKVCPRLCYMIMFGVGGEVDTKMWTTLTFGV